MKFIYISITYLVLLSVKLQAQENLTVEEAITLALKNNFSISIARNDLRIAGHNATFGNAGALPSIALQGGENFQDNNIHQIYNTGLELNRSNVKTNSTSAGIALNWTIFQGFRMYAAYGRLKELEKISEENQRAIVETTVQQVINTYYDIVQQKQFIKAINDNIAIYEEKLKIAKEKFEIGSSSKLDYLQAKVDLNAQKSRFLTQKTNLATSKANLNQLLARQPEIDFNVAETIIVAYKPSYEEIKKTTLEQNTQISIANKNIRVSNYFLKENESLLYPSVSLLSGYNYSLVNNQAGFILLNRNLGFNTGLTANWNIFNGFFAERNIDIARISLLTSKLNFDNTTLQVETNLTKYYETYQSNQQILNLEEENLDVANENVKVALERYRIGGSSEVELRVAQQSLEDAQNRLIGARYNTKVSETDLLRISGQMGKVLQ